MHMVIKTAEHVEDKRNNVCYLICVCELILFSITCVVTQSFMHEWLNLVCQ